MLDQILTRIKAADFGVLGQLHGMTSADGTTIAEQLVHPDPAVRELVLWVLDELGGLAAARAGATAALDGNPQVVGLALRVLRHHAGPAVLGQVEGDYVAAPNPGVRAHLALVLGHIGAPLADVLALASKESEVGSRETLELVAAHLGDPERRERTVLRWRSCRGRRAQGVIEDLDYLSATWSLPHLVGFLDDATPVLRIGAEHLPGPMHLRVCDLTINLAARLGPPPFPFPTDGKSTYSDELIALTKAYLNGLAPT